MDPIIVGGFIVAGVLASEIVSPFKNSYKLFKNYKYRSAKNLIDSEVKSRKLSTKNSSLSKQISGYAKDLLETISGFKEKIVETDNQQVNLELLEKVEKYLNRIYAKPIYAFWVYTEKELTEYISYLSVLIFSDSTSFEVLSKLEVLELEVEEKIDNATTCILLMSDYEALYKMNLILLENISINFLSDVLRCEALYATKIKTAFVKFSRESTEHKKINNVVYIIIPEIYKAAYKIESYLKYKILFDDEELEEGVSYYKQNLKKLIDSSIDYIIEKGV